MLRVEEYPEITKQEYQDQLSGLRAQMASLAQECLKLKIPVAIVFEGWGAAGKGSAITNLLASLDPRGFKVYNVDTVEYDDEMFYPTAKYMRAMPKRGAFSIFNRSWYRQAIKHALKNSEDDLNKSVSEIEIFERQHANDGTCIIKIFLNISEEEQSSRFLKLQEDESTAWRVTKKELKQNKKYDRYKKAYEDVLTKTSFDFAPWIFIESEHKRRSTISIYEMIIEQIELAIAAHGKSARAELYSGNAVLLPISPISEIEIRPNIEREEYESRLKLLQRRVSDLHNHIYKARVPVIVCFEGWDAAGKGGAIKRLTRALDPRGYEVFPIAAPSAVELSHHYLWRFVDCIPKKGHISVFDRTWYGRVMVERIEGFCSVAEWQRAFGEINEFERGLTDWGAVVLKFFINITKDEQLARFNSRNEIPEKKWKLTEEDWRNREKWDYYSRAIDDMLRMTNSDIAPWNVVSSNDKLYARLEVLEVFADAIERRLSKSNI